MTPTITKQQTGSLQHYTTSNLPILKHINIDAIQNKVSTWNKGEKPVFGLLQLLVYGGLAFAAIKWVIPTVFIALGQLLAAVACAGVLLFLYIARKGIFGWIRTLAKRLTMKRIASDPQSQFAETRVAMVEEIDIFRTKSAEISRMQDNMANEAKVNEKRATDLQKTIIKLKGEVDNIKKQMADIVAANGEQGKADDAYVELNSDLLKKLGDSTRAGSQLDQANNFVQRYGTRAAIIKKFLQKMSLRETYLEIKLADYDASVEMLLADAKMASNMRNATTAMKNADGADKSWELVYAIDVVNQGITQDIAISRGNMRDLDMATNQFGMDSDELYSKLESLTSTITAGELNAPTAKQYQNPDYKITGSDKAKAGGLGDLF